MEPANQDVVVDFLRDPLHETGDVMPGWPENVRSIAPNGLLFLGIDERHQLYWDGKPIEILRPLKFSRLQLIAAIIVGTATIIGGIGTGIDEGYDFGCKTLLAGVRRHLVQARVGKTAVATSAAKLAKALIALETYVSALVDLIIDYASARLDDGPFSTSPTEGAVQWLLHRRMGARQQMRWSPRGADLMLQVRTATVNRTLEADHGMSRHRRSFRMAT